MTGLFIKITNEMIANCKRTLLDGNGGDYLWRMEPEVLVDKLESCLGLNEAYQEQCV
jgi:dynein heavy chain